MKGQHGQRAKAPKAYKADAFRCDTCGKVRRTATALDFLPCRETVGCTGHYTRAA